MIRAIIFDCFGVVVTYGFHAAFTAMGGNLDEDKQMLQDLFGMYNSGQMSDDQLLKELGDHLGIDSETVKAALAKDEHIDTRILERIQELRGSYKVGLLSNIGRGGAERYFAGIDTSQYFDDMVLSGEVGLVKPVPEIYQLAAERLSVAPEECVFIDDSQRNAEAAMQAGMTAITYESFEQFDAELNQILSQ